MNLRLLLVLLLLAAMHGQFGLAQDAPTVSQTSTTPPSLKIVKLLWTAQPAGAGAALEKAIDQALVRNSIDQLKPHLTELSDKMLPILNEEPADARWVPAIAALALLGQAPANDLLQKAVSGAEFELTNTKREFLLRCWLAAQPTQAREYLMQLLARANPASEVETSWLETCVARALELDRESVANVLLKRWAQLPRSVQVTAIEPLTHTAVSMKQLVNAIESNTVAKDLLNTNQLMKWMASDDVELKAAIERVWGRLRMSEDSDRKQVVQRTMELLTSGQAGNPVQGQTHFKRICSQCHRLHGEGVELGPDITANGRGSFEQLVSNVMDPSLVIGKAFTGKTILASDGRVVSGLVVAEDPQRITLKVQGGKQMEFDRQEDIDTIKDSVKSLMPDGLEQQMNEQELLDLFAYLSLAKALTATENATIPGTPDKLVP